MKKILLINPVFQKTIYSPLPKRIERSRGKYPPLGLAYLAAMLLREKFETKIYDADVEDTSFSGLKSFLKNYKPDIVGVTCTSFTFLQAKLTAKIIRNFLPEAQILIGGPHVSIYPVEVISNQEFDVAVIGEGENTIVDLVTALDSNSDLRSVKGIIFRENGKNIQTESRPLIDNLDSLPFPARSLLPNEKYSYPLGKYKKFTSVITSRGCPFNCIFCLRARGTHFGRKYRTRSPSNIIDELEVIVKDLKIREIFFYDDIFTLNQHRIEELCKKIIERRIDISWNCRTRVDAVSPRLLNLMMRAGCERIHYGIESGDPQILRNLKKNITIKQIRKAFSLTRSNGIETFAYIMLGSPGENPQSIRRTMQLIKNINPSQVGFFITTLFPGTELYRSALDQGLLSEDIWREFTLGKLETQPLPFFEEGFSGMELRSILKNSYREYYFRPMYLWNRIKNLKSISDLATNLRGLALLLRI